MPVSTVAAPPEARSALKRAALHYVQGLEAGIRRRRSGSAFRYVAPNGKPVTAAATLARIRALAIPPAYENVVISPDPRGHIQATGVDARGRKQYRYHPAWREARDQHKFARLADFATALCPLRARIQADLALPGLPRARVLAAMLRILDQTAMRVGNECYARANASYGLASLRKKHVRFRKNAVVFAFQAKGQKPWRVELADPEVRQVIARARRLPGRRLFRFAVPGGGSRVVAAQDLNDYIKAATGRDITAKDFRTWNATLGAAEVFLRCERERQCGGASRSLRQCIVEVAERLGHTPTVCRKSYLPPDLLAAFEERRVATLLARALPKAAYPGLSAFERRVLRFLRGLKRKA